jgi:glyceraldehyde 3-phosphate dehydrogenase
MGVKVGVNGFGRVGRYIVRACLGYGDIDIVAINSRAKPDILAHFLKYDSVHGKINAEIAVNGDNLLVNGKKIAVTHVMSNLSDLPWKELGVDIALESSGRFRNKGAGQGNRRNVCHGC